MTTRDDNEESFFGFRFQVYIRFALAGGSIPLAWEMVEDGYWYLAPFYVLLGLALTYQGLGMFDDWRKQTTADALPEVERKVLEKHLGAEVATKLIALAEPRTYIERKAAK